MSWLAGRRRGQGRAHLRAATSRATARCSRSAPTWPWSRWTARRGQPTILALHVGRRRRASSSTRCSSRARCTAASPRASARRCWRRPSSTRSGQLVSSTLMDYALPRGRRPDLVRERPHAHRLAADDPGREGHRRGRHHRLHAGHRQRHPRRARPARHHPRRPAAHRAEDLGGDPVRLPSAELVAATPGREGGSARLASSASPCPLPRGERDLDYSVGSGSGSTRPRVSDGDGEVWSARTRRIQGITNRRPTKSTTRSSVDVGVGQDLRLLLHVAVEHRHRPALGGEAVGAQGEEVRAPLLEPRRGVAAPLGHVRADRGLVELAAPRQERRRRARCPCSRRSSGPR